MLELILLSNPGGRKRKRGRRNPHPKRGFRRMTAAESRRQKRQADFLMWARGFGPRPKRIASKRRLRTAARTMRGKPGVTVKDIAFQRGGDAARRNPHPKRRTRGRRKP